MKKKIISVVLVLITLSLCACKYYSEDPFLTETKSGSETGEITGEDTKKTDSSVYVERAFIHPDEDFYTLSASESYEKYGIFSPSNYPNYDYCFDGKSYYDFYMIKTLDKSIITLGKYEYPFGNYISPVCTDPLCTHSPTSTCPFAVCGGSSAKVVCYGGSLFFFTNVGYGLYKYEQKTNKSVLLIDGAHDGCFYRYDGSLYFVYGEEQKDDDGNETFEKFRVFAKISPDGKVTELGRLSDNITTWITVYKDRYAIDYEPVEYDGGYTLNIISRDLQTGDIKKISEYDCAGAAAFDFAETFTVYGDKLLIYFRYDLRIAPAQDKREVEMLIDLETGDTRVICTPDYKTYKQSPVPRLFSDKCIMWFEPKPKKDDPMIVHLYFPYEDKEEVYNFSEMVKEATGDDLPRECYLALMTNGAVGIRRMWKDSNDTQTLIYDIDLPSGRVYKYDVPQ